MILEGQFNRQHKHNRLVTGILLTLALVLTGCSMAPYQSQQKKEFADAPKTGLPSSTAYQPNQLTHHKKDRLLHLFSRWQGTPYQLGGLSRRGIDCSGWTFLVYQSIFQHDIPRTTYRQSQLGRQVPREDLNFGDLVFFKTGRSTRHVGVYIGQKQFMHASTQRGITISSLTNTYWRVRYWQARRLL